MAVDDEAIGLVRGHRWADTRAQTRRLKEAGCKRIFDLDKQNRADMERIAGRRAVRLVYAFLLANPDKTQGMWADFLGVLKRIEAREGVVIDVGTGLDSKAHRAAFLDVTRGQVRRHNQGEKSADNHPKGTPGRKLVVFTQGQHRQARLIWKDVKTYPTYDAAERELAKIKSGEVGFSVSRAFRKFGKRPPKPND